MSLNASEATRICESGDTGVITMAAEAAAQSLYEAFIATSAVAKTGTGTTTLTADGTGYTNGQGKNLFFVIVVTEKGGAADTFKWSDDGCQTWHDGVSVTGSAQTLSDGVTVTFSDVTGGEVGDRFVFTVGIPRNIKAVCLRNHVSSNGDYYYGYRSTITKDSAATAGMPIPEGEKESFEINDLSKVFVFGGNAKSLHVQWIG